MSAKRTRLRGALAVAAMVGLAAPLLAGCAALLPPPAPAASGSGAAATAAGVAASGTTGGAPVDSAPSIEARAVLEAIPEPIPAGERVPPPEKPLPSAAAPADTDAAAALGGTGADSARATVPVPAATQPLGDRPGTLERLLSPDTAAAVTTAPARESAAPVAAPPARTDTCHRVQIAARGEKPRAERLRDAAASQLLAPMVIEQDRGLFKVRSRDCMSRPAADELKRRALASGFAGAFRFVGTPP